MNINDLPTIPLSRKMKDYSGTKMGKFTFLKPAEIKNGKTYWWVQCECGNIEKITPYYKRLGCLECSQKIKIEHLKGKRIKDLTGQRFGRLTVLWATEKRTKEGSVIWHCKCDCGNEKDVRMNNLVNGDTQSCGCLKKEKAAEMGKNTFQDLKNQKFGYLTPISPVKENGRYYWDCLCDCGKMHRVQTENLKDGSVKSCGCKKYTLMKEKLQINMIGQRFGKLLIIEEAGQNIDGSFNYLCQCDCGNQKIINGVSLRKGITTSCGCINYSIGEQNIRNILQENNIPFEQEYQVKELNNKRFDFIIYNDNEKTQILKIIEFDGRQHYEKSNSIWEKTCSFEKRQQRDKEKNEWCFQNNIPLVRIPYWERDKITLEMIMSDQYLVKKETPEEETPTITNN